MKRMICVVATIGALVQGCATSTPAVAHLGAGDIPQATPVNAAAAKLLRFDKSAAVPAQDLVTIAYTATRSEHVEVSCDGMGAAGYETHGGTT